MTTWWRRAPEPLLKYIDFHSKSNLLHFCYGPALIPSSSSHSVNIRKLFERSTLHWVNHDRFPAQPHESLAVHARVMERDERMRTYTELLSVATKGGRTVFVDYPSSY